MDRLFDSFMGGLPTFPSMFGPTGTRGFALTPSLDAKETNKEIEVEAAAMRCSAEAFRQMRFFVQSVGLHSQTARVSTVRGCTYKADSGLEFRILL
jgi:hypothetical protein